MSTDRFIPLLTVRIFVFIVAFAVCIVALTINALITDKRFRKL